MIRAGTSATFTIEYNGVAIPELTDIVITPAETFYPSSSITNINDGDVISAVCSAISGTPDGLSLGIVTKVVG